MSIKTFKRLEKKYLLTMEQYEELRKRMEPYMTYDEYCPDGALYSIYNIYYDTDRYRLIRASLAKPYYKEKLRLRSYSPLGSEDSPVFLELKKKVGGIVTKRRAALSYRDASDFVSGRRIPTMQTYLDRQVLREISYFTHQYPITPAAAISYDRAALFGLTDPDFRITFDFHICSQDLRQASSPLRELLDPGTCLMEVKLTGAAPLWLAEAFSALNIHPASFSKYGVMYKQMCPGAKRPA